MSRPYRIVVKKVIEEELAAADRATLRLSLDPVLPAERLDALLAAALERHGWEQTAPGVWRKAAGDEVELACDVAAREVTATVHLRETLREERRRELKGDTWNWREQREMTDHELEALRRDAEERLSTGIADHKRRQAERDLRQRAADLLAASADERRRAVNRLVLEVLSDALKEKAQELGQVERIDEAWHGEDFELTIAIAE